jgi:hypothetical protein
LDQDDLADTTDLTVAERSISHGLIAVLHLRARRLAFWLSDVSFGARMSHVAGQRTLAWVIASKRRPARVGLARLSVVLDIGVRQNRSCSLDHLVGVAQGLGDEDRQASRDEKGDRGAGASGAAQAALNEARGFDQSGKESECMDAIQRAKRLGG